VHSTYSATIDSRGRLTIPATLRESAGLNEGTPLVMMETSGGIVLMTRDQLKQLVRSDLTGLDLVEELVRERSQESEQEALV
jgi:AbrB family looped-hinge helix DNA binding protein